MPFKAKNCTTLKIIIEKLSRFQLRSKNKYWVSYNSYKVSMKRIILLFKSILCLTVLSSCAVSERDNDSTRGEKEFTGPLISGIYEFGSYAEFESFYEVYRIKNTEEFLVLNLDSLEHDVEYYFVSGGVNSHVIHERTYDYDFPNPSFVISIDSMSLYFFDISQVDRPDDPNHFVQADESDDYRYHFYIDEFEVGMLQSENMVEADLIDYLDNEFIKAFDNI